MHTHLLLLALYTSIPRHPPHNRHICKWTSVTRFWHTLFLYSPTLTSLLADSTVGSYKTHTRNAHLWAGCLRTPDIYLWCTVEFPSYTWHLLPTDLGNRFMKHSNTHAVQAGTPAMHTWSEGWSMYSSYIDETSHSIIYSIFSIIMNIYLYLLGLLWLYAVFPQCTASFTLNKKCICKFQKIDADHMFFSQCMYGPSVYEYAICIQTNTNILYLI